MCSVLQELLPDARLIYSSATGATEVSSHLPSPSTDLLSSKSGGISWLWRQHCKLTELPAMLSAKHAHPSRGGDVHSCCTAVHVSEPISARACGLCQGCPMTATLCLYVAACEVLPLQKSACSLQFICTICLC